MTRQLPDCVEPLTLKKGPLLREGVGMNRIEMLIHEAWREDQAEGAEYFFGRTRLDELIAAELGGQPVGQQSEFIGALALPDMRAHAGTYSDFDEGDPDLVRQVATMFSVAAALRSLPAVAPKAFGLILDRWWPDPGTTEGDFWEEWDGLVAHLGQILDTCSADEACAYVRSAEWAAVVVAARLHPEPAVLTECAARSHWFDSTAQHAARGFLLLNPALPERVRARIVSEACAGEWYWAAQRLPDTDEDAFSTIIDSYRWDILTDLRLHGPTVTDEAVQSFAIAALGAIQSDPDCMVEPAGDGEIGWDETVGVFGTLAQQSAVADELLREIAAVDGGSCARFVLANPNASDETRALARLMMDGIQ